MKIGRFTKVVGLLGAMAFGTALASAAPVESMRVNVPFAFVVSGKVFPAGLYTIQESDTGVIVVEGASTSAAALTTPGGPAKLGTAPGLRFTATNGHEYLIAVESEFANRHVPVHSYEARTLTLSH